MSRVSHFQITTICHPEPRTCHSGLDPESFRGKLDSGSIRNQLVKIPKQVRNDTNCQNSYL